MIGERLNSADLELADAGAAWVYEGVPGGFSSPVELQASDGDVGNVYAQVMAEAFSVA